MARRGRPDPLVLVGRGGIAGMLSVGFGWAHGWSRWGSRLELFRGSAPEQVSPGRHS